MSSDPLPHVYTLTGNLLAERTLEFRHWSPGATQRAERETFQVGGKGINVSKMLNRLGTPNTALCFSGGASGSECETWLRQRGFSYRIFSTSTATRTGTVVRVPGQPDTTFLGVDTPPDAVAVRACAEFLDALPGGNVLAICGSIPGWDETRHEPLRDALARWLSRGCLVADTYGPPLRWLAQQPLDLIKINAGELQTLDPAPAGREPLAALRYVITDGPRAVRLREGIMDERLVVPPTIREVSATGSGDVLLACVLESLFRRRKSLAEAVAFALPYAAANAADPGIAEFADPA
ncbi:MAG TPA: PfkB family carbohydrate kinase [Opitutaceae bacterium]|nr:PfkB family carbohydrate kinase [Opitutaceae bacterium]